MYQEKMICIVIPAYNEEKLIGRVVTTMPDFVDKIVVVDDCSTDGTVEVVKNHISNGNKRLTLLSHDNNRGVGGAIMTGYHYARDNLFDVTVVMAGDAQMDPDDLPSLIDPVVQGKADYAKGNRLFSGEAWHIIPHARYLGNAALSFMTKIVSGYWHVTDSQTGYTAASLNVLQTLPLKKVFQRYGMPNDFLVRLNVYDFRVVDVPIKPIYGIGEKSGIHLGKAVPRLSWLLAGLFLWRMKEKYILRDFHPLIFFYMLGFLSSSAGFIMGCYLLYYRIFNGAVTPTSALFAAFLFLTGMQSIFFAMWMDMQHGRSNNH